MSTTLYFLFVLAIILPFQLGLVPTYAVMRDFGLVGSYIGIILLYTGIWMPFAVFLYTGFVLALPKEYEEASRVDGATSLRTFRKVVFPLLRPVTGTVAIFTGLIIWNDFFLSLIYLNGTDKTPLPVAVYTFVGAFASRWNLIFAAVHRLAPADHALLPRRPASADPRLHRRHQDLGAPWRPSPSRTSARPIPTARAPSPISTSRSPTASSSSSSARPAAARRPRCGWSPGSRR